MQNNDAYVILLACVEELLNNKSNIPNDMNIVQEEIVKLVSSYLSVCALNTSNEFNIICDESNNSPEDIDNSKLNVSIEVWGTFGQLLKESGILNE